MQTVSNPFKFIPGDSIQWPSDDKKLRLINSWVNDVDLVVKHCTNFSNAVQAGGACGIWPARLACYFEHVYTLEPCKDNYGCLVRNVRPFENVTHCRAGLGATHGTANLQRDDFEDGNAGAWYTTPGADFPIVTIDSMCLDDCGLIMLDVEGAELEALLGALQTIDAFKPVICVEQKQLPHMKHKATATGEFLKTRGYQIAAKYHNDVVYIC